MKPSTNKQTYLLISSIFLAILFSVTAKSNSRQNTIRIGATAGDFAELVRGGLQPELEKLGYKVVLREFTDYVTPNLSLAEGSLDLNIFQHKPYLEQFAKDRKLSLTAIAEVPTAPLSLYGGKLKSLHDVKEGSAVALPNDATNLSRALTILADLNWIELNPNSNPILVSLKDVKKNTYRLKLLLLEAAQLPRSLQDVDYAVINGNFATSAGIPLRSALKLEKSDLYINWAVTTEAKSTETFARDTVTALNSPTFQKFAREKFKGYKFPSRWK